MEIQILKDDTNDLEIQTDNQTVAEILRVYLNNDDNVKLAAWRREHYSKPILLKITTEGKTAKKTLHDAIFKLQKDLEKYSEEFKRAIK